MRCAERMARADRPKADTPSGQTSERGGDRSLQMPLLSLLPNLITLLGLCAGLTAIRFALDAHYEIAAALIVLAAVLDGADGLVARRLNAASSFGAELDTLSDFVCFGVAPGVLIFQFAFREAMPALGWLFVLVFILCVCLRLARFNVSRDAPPPPGRAHFVGVPAPAGAMLALLPLFVFLADGPDLRAITLALALYLAFVGVLMVSRLPTISPKGMRVPRRRAIWLFLGVAVFAGLVVARPWALLVLADFAYLALLARSAWTHRRRLG